MIESYFWRRELRTDLAWLHSRRRVRRWTEKQQVLYERRLMLVAFQIRTLLDRPKVSRAARSIHLDAQIYPKTGKRPVTVLNATALDENFDLENPRAVRLSIREVCNQLMHHYVLFAMRGSKGAFDTILVFSDYRRHHGLYELDMGLFLETIDVFASEASAADHVHFHWSEKRQDYVFS